MAEIITGDLLVRDSRFAIIVSRFNELVTSRLLDGALDTLRRHGATEEQLSVIHVPGAFELPLAARKVADSGDFDAVCCLGAVIQGETTHHDYINHQVAAGLMDSMLHTSVPITFGVLTCQNMEQALDRAGGKAGNKGVEAALAAIETVNVLRDFDS